MLWVWIIVLAALGGLVMIGWFAVRLWRRLRLVVAELGVLQGQLDTALGLVERIGEQPGGRVSPVVHPHP